MLSIKLDATHEWWVSGKTFDRLFQSALEHGDLNDSMENWMHVANANGGLDVSLLDPDEASRLVDGLKRAAERQVDAVGDADPATDDGAYVTEIREYLGATGS